MKHPRNNNSTVNDEQVGGDHYQTHDDFQLWDFIDRYEIPFMEGNFLKYVIRHRNKNGLEDLKKAEHYLTKINERGGFKRIEAVQVDDFAKIITGYNLNRYEICIFQSVITADTENAELSLVGLINQTHDRSVSCDGCDSHNSVVVECDRCSREFCSECRDDFGDDGLCKYCNRGV